MTEAHGPSPYPAPGEVLDGKYKVEKVLGEGGMGCVVRAYHTLLRAPVALKFMNPQFITFPGAVERFLNEGTASQAIQTDHVVQVQEVGKLANGTPYLVMPCLEGHDLAELLAREGSPGLAIERAVHFVIQILRGLQAAHAIGIIHRDMKPSNCFVVNKDGEDDFVRILDFGISKVQQPGSASLTQTNSALGTPLYMSPEQARSPRDVDGRSDIYSVGVILYELLSGHTPFFSESGEFTEILFKLFTADPPPVQSTRPDIPDALAAVVHKALAREPKDRYATALEVALALEPFAGEHSKPLLARMKAFKPPTKKSMAPPEMLPPSMEAFSQLDQRPQTDVMMNRPTTDVQKSPPMTQAMPHAPAGKKGTAVMSPATPRSKAAVAKTAYDESRRPAVPGASTDLGASRDADDAEPSRPIWIYLLPATALVVVAGFVWAVTLGPLAKHDTPVVASAPPSASTSLPVVASSAPAITPPVASSVPSSPASVASTVVSTPPKPPVVVRPPPHTNPNHDPGLDPGIVR